MKTIIQIALDFVDLKRALKLAKEAVAGGADWLEAGTPLIKSAGMDSIRELRKQFPANKIVADMKTIDAGRAEVEIAAKSGADIVVVLGAASDSTIKECVEAAGNYGAKIMVDFMELKSLKKRIREVEKLGVDYLCVHTAIDEQMKGRVSFKNLRELSAITKLPVAVAGGINSESAAAAVKAGADIVIIGGAINKSSNAEKAVREIKTALARKIKIKTELYRRVIDKPDIIKILLKVSAANVSDALHRQGALEGLSPVTKGVKLIGPAFTVRTFPGDWAKPVEAIDLAEAGSIIVIDAGGVGPAVWGELAACSALKKGIVGVVIDGAIRDTEEIAGMKFPAYAKIITPAAGEPKGFGETGVPVNICGKRVYPGDWLVGDSDGVLVIPGSRIAEITNRAMDVLEKENRIRKEINEGSSLGKITELLRWEKKG